ncbi:MAG: hypothetical protein ABIG31_02445 [Candidatus Omnitrophota bacterium]
MKRWIAVLLMAVFSMVSLWVLSFAEEVAWEEIGRGILDAKAVLVNADTPRIIYIGSSDGVFKSEDAGSSWNRIFSAGGRKKEVNFLFFDPTSLNKLYAATSQGLFYSDDAAEDWRQIFTGKHSSEKECTAVAVLSSGIFLGTKKGLFMSRDMGRTWHKARGQMGDTPILAISGYNLRPNDIFVAALDGAFKTQDAGTNWEKIFTVHPVENGDNGQNGEEDGDEEERFSEIRYISVDPDNSNEIYLATANGIYLSRDKGGSWEAMTGYGLLHREVKFILAASHPYAVTKSKVFEFKEERWQELSSGLIADDIRFLAQDSQGHLYAACDKGVFKSSLKGCENNDRIGRYAEKEPTIRQIQQAAIHYAEVEPEKIRLWRKQAAKKAILPRLTVGLDRNTTDLWHWEGGSTTKTEDDILRRGRDSLEWDVTLSWDLGELIWASDQTSIDVRSRLMVQLRDDVLDEVTKLYFERIRVKMELDNLTIEDRKKRFEKELRLQELTAQLDGVTGGYFSSKTGS